MKEIQKKGHNAHKESTGSEFFFFFDFSRTRKLERKIEMKVVWSHATTQKQNEHNQVIMLTWRKYRHWLSTLSIVKPSKSFFLDSIIIPFFFGWAKLHLCPFWKITNIVLQYIYVCVSLSLSIHLLLNKLSSYVIWN